MRIRILALGLISVLSSSQAFSSDSSEINDHIYGMKYDPRVLLALPDDGNVEGSTRIVAGDEVIVCRSVGEDRSVSGSLPRVTIFTPGNGIVYPGALVRANRDLAEGRPSPISIHRAPMTIALNLPGAGPQGSLQVEDPRNSTVQEAVHKLLEQWHSGPGKSYTPPAAVEASFASGSSSNAISSSLGISASWAGNRVSGAFSGSSDTEHTSVVSMYRQIYYTVTVDNPRSPAEVLAPQVTLADFRNRSGNDVPAFIQSVDYGRIILIRMETENRQTTADAEAALKYSTGDTSASGDLRVRYENIARHSNFQVWTIGGNAANEVQALRGEEAIRVLPEMIRSGAVYSRENPGAPISYSVRFLRDNAQAAIFYHHTYRERRCVAQKGRSIVFRNGGGYNAQWKISWKEGDEHANDKFRMVQRYELHGTQFTLHFPGDAHDVRIFAEARTGLVGNMWREAANRRFRNLPEANQCVRLRGTTISPWSEVFDSNDCR